MRFERIADKPKKTLEEWHLGDYINAAVEVKLIDKEAAAQSMLAKGFRNLIHPGRVQRLGQSCDRGTAYAALAAVEFVQRDLAKRFT